MKSLSIPRLFAAATLLALAMPALGGQAAPEAAARIKGMSEAANKDFREKAFENARAGYAKILADPDASLAQRIEAINRTADAWRQEKAFDKARAEYAKIPALPGVSADQRVDALNRTADTWRQAGDSEQERAEYARILAMPELTVNQRVAALNRTADTWKREKAFDKARAEYAKILAIADLSVNQQIDALGQTADAWNGEGKGAEARKVCEVVLKRSDFPENQRRVLLERVAGSYVADGDVAKLTEALVSMAPLYPTWTWGYTDLHNKLEQLAAKKLTARDFPAALAGYVYLAGLTNLDVRRRSAVVKGVVKARAGVKDAARRAQAARSAEQALRWLADHPKTSPQDRLLYRIQLAALPGLDGDFKGMEKALDEVLKVAEDIPKPELLAIVQNANILFMSAREYEVARVLKARTDALIEAPRTPNVYTCCFLAEVPKGAGAWAQSGFVKDARNANTRFFAYPGGEEDKLAADMGALRPLAEKSPEAAKGREMALYMAYGTYGWHIFIRTDEPDIEQIMIEDGRRGSTLEMFFAPGLKGQVYYQWLVNLAQAKTDIYHWNTPHRFYRYLENKVGSLQTGTAVLKTGWGTAITIAWEALYDKLPFLEGNEDTWRFSTMRWGPVNMTWGGTVHETGRWGMIKWQPPTPAQLLEIQRNIVRRAWWRYQARKAQLTEFWKGARGDPAFCDQVLAPFFAKQDALGEQMKQAAHWDAKTVCALFAERVRLWMELDHLVEEWRADFISRGLFAE